MINNLPENKAILVGFNTFEDDVVTDNKCFVKTADGGKNIDFTVCHFDSYRFGSEEYRERVETVAKKHKEIGADFIANYEFQNFGFDCTDKDGFDWANRENGTHLLNFPEGYVECLAKNGNLAGIMYDEFEHVIANRNLSISLESKFKRILTAFPVADGSDPVEQGELLGRQLKEYADGIKQQGAPALYGEHVFPILFHKFCENGLLPNFKSQKESVSNIQFAIAGGAALQYGTELMNCVDLWYRMTNPGHSPEELYHNLVFSYLCGADRVYVESSHAFFDDRHNEDGFNEYGKKFDKFAKEYKGKARNYNIRDYRPEIGIIRYDDTFWGQNDPLVWRKMLFGNKKVKPDSRSREYIKVLHLLSHGYVCPNGLSWDRFSPWSLHAHRSFVPLNSAAVFDGNVRKNTLSSLKLCFLCGIHISKETIGDVAELVRDNGLTVVTTKRFAPDGIKSKAKGSWSEISDGKGKWIVINSYRNSKLKKFVKPYIGNDDEIRLTFENDTVVLKISENGETFDIVK